MGIISRRIGVFGLQRMPGFLLAGLLPLLLVACGGGGGASGGAEVAPPVVLPVPPLSAECQPGSVARLVQDSAAQQGRNTEVALLACPDRELRQLRWTQIAGPALNPLSARSQAISVDPQLGQSYRFELSYLDEQGRSFRETLPLEAKALADANSLQLRGEPSVMSGGKTSVRATHPLMASPEWAAATVLWTQVDGPSLDLGERSAWRLLLTAPALTQDATVRLRATVTLSGGRQASGEFSLLVQAQPLRLPAEPLFGSKDPASRVYPYLAQGPYAAALDDCIYNPRLSRGNPNTLCTLGRLPLLGQATGGAVPTVEQVMERVLVSNDWMGEVFERFLREQDPQQDFRRMLSSVTAIVIGGRVRPSFYWSATGAIYLDGSFFWLSPEQRDTVSESPDPRSNFGAALNYASPWRYVKNNSHAYASLAREPRLSRALVDLTYPLGSLLYHELTHAADFMPPLTHASLPSNKRVYEAGPARSLSQNLYEQLPFYSSEMQGLAKVLSFGATATALQQSYTPSDVAGFFSRDRVSDDYAYSVPDGANFSREDAAMLLEEAMMQLRYGVLRDYAVTNKLQDGALSADLIVNWGQRGRIGEAAIKPRVKLVLAEAMPWVSPGLVDSLAAPQPLRTGQSWGANLDQAALAAGRIRPLSAQQRFNELEQTTRELRSR